MMMMTDKDDNVTVTKKGDGDDNDECGNNKKAVRGLKQAPVHPHTTLTFSYTYI